MRHDGGPLMNDLQQLLREFDKLVKAARGALGEQTEDVAEHVREGLDNARDRLKTGARVVDDYLRDNTWTVVALAAAAAFVAGVLLTRRK
jgi:ElaB/YqjD/DUF883 family membrane-anchored ribosome-binding protein